MSWVTRGTRSQDQLHPAAKQRSALADAFVDSWVSWREASEDVRAAYRSWSECARPQRALAFAGYRAALDREQHAACIHADWAERVRALGPDTTATKGDGVTPYARPASAAFRG
jgi:hypothetical protein